MWEKRVQTSLGDITADEHRHYLRAEVLEVVSIAFTVFFYEMPRSFVDTTTANRRQ
jgi:hypothetical protein